MESKTETILDLINGLQELSETALVFGEEKISYHDFVESGRSFAKRLVQSGVKKGDRVLLCRSRGIDYFTSLYGILTAGAAYIPADPDWPMDRKMVIMEDAHALMMVTDDGLVSSRGGMLEEQPSKAGQEAVSFPEIRGEEPFGIFYTSGSTGKPKGTVVAHIVQHNNALVCDQNIFASYTVRECGTILSLLNPVYSFVILDVFIALCNGKKLVLATEEEFNNAQALGRCIESNGVEAISITPSLLERYLANEEFCRAFQKLKRVALSGEKLSVKQAEHFQERTRAKLFNGYGSSEMLHCSDALYEPGKDIYIGVPDEGVKLYVLRKDDSQAEVGEQGELYIGGVPARYAHYLDREDLNAERYHMHPRLGRLFRTGDGAVRTADGQISVFGRIDGVMKLHGQRLDPGEIEQLIEQFPGISKGVVQIHGSGSKAMLCGYYTAEKVVDHAELRKWLSGKLPHYMIPVFFMRLEGMPVNARGKIDRSALPFPEKEAKGVLFEAPACETERVLCALFEQALDCVSPVSTRDNFFALGGDSIRGMQIVSEAEAEGIRLSLSALFANPEVRQLSDYLKENGMGMAADLSPDQTKKDSPQVLDKELPEGGWKDRISEKAKKAIMEEVPWENVEAVYPFLPNMWDRVRFDHDRKWLAAEMLEINERLDEEKAKKRFDEMTAMHQALRDVAVFPEGERPLSVIMKKVDNPLIIMDVRDPKAKDGEMTEKTKEKILSELHRFSVEGFSKGRPLSSITLFRTGETKWMMCIMYSHFVLDGTSHQRLADELLSDAVLTSDADDFGRYYQRQDSASYQAEVKAYWKRTLFDMDGYTALPGGPDPSASDESSFRFRKMSMDPIRDYCKTHEVTTAVVIHVALGMTLAKMTGQKKVAFMTIGNGRPEELTEDQRLTGMFSCDYPFVYEAGERPEDCQKRFLDGLKYMGFDYTLLGGRFADREGSGGTIRCNIMNCQMARKAVNSNGVVMQDSVRELLTVCPRDLLIYFIPEDNLYMTCVYRPSAVAPCAVSALMRTFVKSIAEIVNPSALV